MTRHRLLALGFVVSVLAGPAFAGCGPDADPGSVPGGSTWAMDTTATITNKTDRTVTITVTPDIDISSRNDEVKLKPGEAVHVHCDEYAYLGTYKEAAASKVHDAPELTCRASYVVITKDGKVVFGLDPDAWYPSVPS